MSTSAQLHHEFFSHAENMPQKVALSLDEQTLSFAEVAHYVQMVAVHLKEIHHVQTDEVVYQMLQRSLELPIGYFAILTAGGLYCALDPADSSSHTDQLIEQTGSGRCVIVQEATDRPMAPSRIRIDQLLSSNSIVTDADLAMLSKTVGRRAFLTCTSGTTGRAKIIVHTHESTIWQARSYQTAGLISEHDTITAWASSSFIIHLIDLAYAWPNGASLLVLKEGGHMDTDYLTRTIERHQATYLLTSPVILQMLTDLFQEQPHASNRLHSLRILSTAGESLKTSVLLGAAPYIPVTTTFVNLFGQSECQCVCTYQVNDVQHASFVSSLIPTGRALPGCTVALFDENEKAITTVDTIGELFVAGPGLFEEYLDEPELTAKRFAQIDGVRYVRTGDLQKWDANHDLVHVSRVDYQIKLRGQRLEPAEIEHVVASASPDIHECIVMKVEHEEQAYLVAYLASTVSPDAETNLITTVEQACSSYLSPIKRPSIYRVWTADKLPRTPNGKINRAALGPLELSNAESHVTMTHLTEASAPTELDIQQIWEQLLPTRENKNDNHLSLDTNWYQLGGDSLTMMKLISLYRRDLIHGEYEVPVTELFQKATIRDHTQILGEFVRGEKQNINLHTKQTNRLQKTNQTKGPIGLFWEMLLDIMSAPRLQATAEWDLLNVVLVFAVSKGSVSIQRLRRALHLVIRKHATLHTSVSRDPISNKWIQQVQPLVGEGFSLITSQIDMSPTAIEHLVQKEYAFGIHDMKNGCIVRLHIVRRSDGSEKNGDSKLVCGDIIIINIRHEAIDGTSIPILFDSLTQAYSTGELPVDSHALSYLDYMLYLRNSDLSPSFAYWDKQMESFDFAEHFKRLPQDRPYLLGQATCNSSHIVSFRLDQDALRAMLECASTNNVTLATVCAACHAGLLFELTGDWDVAFETTVANRPDEPQATHILGNFFYLPLMRVHLDNNRETTLPTLLKTIQAHTNSSLLHARAQWSPVGNKTLELSDDKTTVYYPITSFQFEQYQKSFILDSSSTTEAVELEYVHNDRDTLLAGLWARAAGRSAFFTEAFYMLPDMQLTFGMFFSSASYNESTSVSIRGLRYCAVE